jgi:hypothetical protein
MRPLQYVWFRLSEESASSVPPDTSPPFQHFFTHPFLSRGPRRSKRSPPATVLIQIPDPRAPSQTRPTPPFPSQGRSAPCSATCGSPPAVPGGPKPRGPPWPTTFKSSSCVGRRPKDGAIAVPPAAETRSHRASSPNPRAMTRFRSARTVRWVRRVRRRWRRCCRRKETRRNTMGDTGRHHPRAGWSRRRVTRVRCPAPRFPREPPRVHAR